MPGGMRGGGGEVDNEEFYKVLEVDKNASSSEIKKAFRKKAIQHHPDKGGDPDTFKSISEAYDVLSDPDKKETYDRFGKAGLEQGGGGGGAEDIFSAFFGGGGRGGGRSRGPAKGEDVVHPLKVTLENLCNGRTVKLRIDRQRVKYPEGMDAESAVSECSTCRGRGVVMRTQQIGPGMIQQMQAHCPTCNGQGKSYKKGVKITKEKKVLEVYVDKGMKHRQKIVFSGEADEAPGVLPGDVVFVIDEQPHETFKRKGADLLMEKTISLKQALTGFRFSQKHPDGRTLVIKSEPGEIVKPNALKMVSDGGMPVHKSPFTKGRLFILFKVEFPDKLTAPQVTALSAALPGPADEKVPEIDASKNVEEASMIEAKPEMIGQVKATGAHGANYDSDDDDEHHGHGQRVQCPQS